MRNTRPAPSLPFLPSIPNLDQMKFRVRGIEHRSTRHIMTTKPTIDPDRIAARFVAEDCGEVKDDGDEAEAAVDAKRDQVNKCIKVKEITI